MLLTVGESDPFAKAYHAKKMAASLQAASSSSHPVLLRVRPGGHDPGSLDEQVSELTDIYAFLFDRLSIDYRPPPTGTARKADHRRAAHLPADALPQESPTKKAVSRPANLSIQVATTAVITTFASSCRQSQVITQCRLA